MRKTLAMLLVFVCLFSMFVPAVYATEEQDVQPRFTRLAKIEKTLTFGGGKANCSATALSGTYSDSVSITVKLQQKISGSWYNQATWTNSGGWQCTAGGTDDVDSGYYYRLRIDVKVYDSNGTLQESATDYSTEKYY